MTTSSHVTADSVTGLWLPLLGISVIFYTLSIVAFFKKRTRARLESKAKTKGQPT